MPIDTIKVQGVRGIKDELTIELKGQSLLVLGDNGTGKSSLEAALRWALTGANEPTADASFTTPESFRRHVRTKPSHPGARVHFKDGSSISVCPGNVQTSGKGDQYRDACKAAPPFLRRAELLNVLTSRPVERFQYFESFLGLDAVDQAIKGLGDERAVVERRASSLRDKIDGQLSALRALLPSDLGVEFRSVAAYRAWVWDRAKQLGIGVSGAEWEDLVKAVRDAADLAASGQLEEQRGLLKVLEQDLDRVAERWVSWSGSDLDALLTELSVAETQTASHEMVELIEHALAHLRKKPGDECPVCGQKIAYGNVVTDLEKRYAQLTRVRELRHALRGAWSALADQVAAVTQLLPQLQRD